MTHSERSAGQPVGQEHQPAPIEMRLTPTAEEAVVFEQEADGRLKLSFTGRTEIIFPKHFTTESYLRPVDGGTFPLPDSSEAVRSEPHMLQADQNPSVSGVEHSEASKSPVTDENT